MDKREISGYCYQDNKSMETNISTHFQSKTQTAAKSGRIKVANAAG